MRLEDELMALGHARDALVRQSNALNEALETLEDAIERQQPGVGVWFSEQHSHPQSELFPKLCVGDDNSYYDLGYHKHGSRWRLVVRRCNGGGVFQSANALLDAPRHVRVAAVPHIAALLRAMNERANNICSDVAQAERDLQVLLKAVSK